MNTKPKVLVATEKPFAAEAVQGIRDTLTAAGIITAVIEKYASTYELYQAVGDADGLIVRSDRVTGKVISAAQRLKIVVRAGSGYDNIDLEGCTARNIVVMNTPGQNANAVAELAIGMMVYMLRNAFTQGTGSELRGKKLGIYGYGCVGRQVALLGRAFHMDVYAYETRPKLDTMFNDGVKPCLSAEELFAACHCVSLHIPANQETRQIVNGKLAARMQQGSVIINTARREIIDEESLFETLRQRSDLRYATDIAPALHHEMKAILGTRYFATYKKMGAETIQANINAGIAAARQIAGFFKNGDKTFQINK